MITPKRVHTRGQGKQIPREKKKRPDCNPKETSLHWELLYPEKQTQNENDQAQLGLAHKSPWLKYISGHTMDFILDTEEDNLLAPRIKALSDAYFTCTDRVYTC